MSKPNNDNIRDGKMVAEWIAKVGRQKTDAVISHFGMPRNYALLCLRAAFLDGKLAKVRKSHDSWWTDPKEVPAMKREKILRDRAYTLARHRRLRSMGVVDNKGALLEAPDWDIEQRLIPAIGASPVVTTGVKSIFHLGLT